MRLLALVAALLFTAGTAAVACPMHTAGHGQSSQTVAQKPPAQSGTNG